MRCAPIACSFLQRPSPAGSGAAKFAPCVGVMLRCVGRRSFRSSAAPSRPRPVCERRGPRAGARTVALTALAIEEFRRHKAQQAEELLRLGVRQTDDMHVVAQTDGQPLNRTASPMSSSALSQAPPCRRSASTTSGTAMPRTCWRAACIRRSRRSALVTRLSPRRWTCTRTYCPACRPTRRPALTRSCGKR